MNTKIIYLLVLLFSVMGLCSCQEDEIGGYATAEEVQPYTGVYRGKMTAYLEDAKIGRMWQQVKIETLEDTIALTMEQFRVEDMYFGDIILKGVEAQKDGEEITFHSISNEKLGVSTYKMNVEVKGKVSGNRLEITYDITSVRTPSVSGTMIAERQEHILDDSVAITRMSFTEGLVLVQPEIDEETRSIRFFVADTISDSTRVLLRPQIELYPGCTSEVVTGDTVDFTKGYTGIRVWAEDSVHSVTYYVSMQAVRSYPQDFDTWVVRPLQETDTAGQYYLYLEPYRWATNNDWLRCAKKKNCYAKSGAYPVERVKQAFNSEYAARIRTLKISKGSEKYPYYLHAGTLFIGSYAVDPETLEGKASYGETFDTRPVSVTGYYQYQPGSQLYQNNEPIEGQDSCCFKAVLYEVVNMSETLDYTQWETDPRVVAIGSFQSAEKVTKYTPFSFSLEYLKDYNSARKYKLAVAFCSSKYGEQLIGAPGSTLYIDEVNIVGR